MSRPAVVLALAGAPAVPAGDDRLPVGMCVVRVLLDGFRRQTKRVVVR